MKPVNQHTDAQRGAALIEAAVALPVLMLLVFGIMEMGMLMRDNLTLAQATRDGARAASAFGNIDGADFRTLQIIEQAANAVPDKVVTRIVIFDPGIAEVNGVPSDSCKAGIAVVNECNVYEIADLLEPHRFGDCSDTTTLDYYYCPSDRDVTVDAGYVGVWIEFEHRYVTGLFGDNVTLTDQTIIRLEPKDF